MKQWGVWFSWGLMILATLTACAGQPAEVQSTAAVVGEASATLPPTNTPAPTSTSEPTETMTPTHTPVPSPTPEPTSEIALGTIRNNPYTQLTEIYAGNGQYVPTPLEDQFFDPTHLIIEGELMHYRSDGLTVMWSDDLQEWTFPEQFPDEVEKVVPISLMGGKIEISDYQEAWRAHQEIVLNWLNSEFNREFRARVYGSENLLTWDDLVVTNEQGEIRYVVRLHDSVTGEKVWPELGGVTAEMKPIHSNLGDTIDNGENITELDVSSPLLLVAGWKEWQNGVGNFYENSTSGPRNASGVYWAGYGLRFTMQVVLLYRLLVQSIIALQPIIILSQF